jgi:hypothetical protein
MIMHFLQYGSPWLAYIATALFVVAVAEFGRVLGLYWRRRQPGAPASDLTTLEAAAFGLLALMIGFSFAMAVARFDGRLQGVRDEANAIATTALRARMLPEPYADRAKKLLAEYLQIRLELIKAPNDDASLDRAVRRSTRVQESLWQQAVAVSALDPHSIPAGLFAASLNQMIDLQAVRLAAARNRLPGAVLALLYGIAVVAIGLSSYIGGLAGRSGHIPHVLMAVLFASVITMVVDIDRSRTGFVTVSQQAMTSLEESLGH